MFRSLIWDVLASSLYISGCIYWCYLCQIRSPATLLGTPVQLPVNANIESANQVAATQCGQDKPQKFELNIRLKKKGDLSSFGCGMLVPDGWSEFQELLGFSQKTTFDVYRERSERRSYPASSKPMLVPEVRGGWCDWFKMIERQLKEEDL